MQQQQQEPAVRQQLQHETQAGGAAGAAGSSLNSGRISVRDKTGGMVTTEVPNSEATRAACTVPGTASDKEPAASGGMGGAVAAASPCHTAIHQHSPSARNRMMTQTDALYMAAAELAAAAAEGMRKRVAVSSETAAAADFPRSTAHRSTTPPAEEGVPAIRTLSPDTQSRQPTARGEAAATEGTGTGWRAAGAVTRLVLTLPTRGFQLLLRFLIGFFRRLATVVRVMSSALMLSSAPPFVEIYEKGYGQKHPVFFSGTLAERIIFIVTFLDMLAVAESLRRTCACKAYALVIPYKATKLTCEFTTVHAIDAARRSERLLVMYFHCRRSPVGERFCTHVLTDDLVIDLLDQSSIFYAIDAMYSSEAARLTRAFFPTNPRLLPALAILLPPATNSMASSSTASSESSGGNPAASTHTAPTTAASESLSTSPSPSSASSSQNSRAGAAGGGGRGGTSARRIHHTHVHLRVRWLLQGLQAPTLAIVEDVVAALVRAQEKNDEAKEQRVKQLQEVETNRRLRAEQEREFEEVVRQERLKAQQMEEQRLAEERRRRLREERHKQHEKRREERKAAAEKIRQQLKDDESASTSSAPPATQKEASVMVSLRLSSGGRFCRSFPATASLEDLYLWADCLGELSDRPDVVIPWRFDLVVPPREILKRGPETLFDAGLYPSAALLLVPVEEEE